MPTMQSLKVCALVKMDGGADSISPICYRLCPVRDAVEAGFVRGEKHPSYFGTDHFNETRVSSNR